MGGKVAFAAAAVPRGGMPCRCVVRNREVRLGLPGFDCEMCRSFYGAVAGTIDGTGAMAERAARACRAASRHRLEHAPVCTPPGFWDLSFPQEHQDGMGP